MNIFFCNQTQKKEILHYKKIKFHRKSALNLSLTSLLFHMCSQTKPMNDECEDFFAAAAAE
jgi:hypothetical protein